MSERDRDRTRRRLEELAAVDELERERIGGSVRRPDVHRRLYGAGVREYGPGRRQDDELGRILRLLEGPE